MSKPNDFVDIMSKQPYGGWKVESGLTPRKLMWDAVTICLPLAQIVGAIAIAGRTKRPSDIHGLLMGNAALTYLESRYAPQWAEPYYMMCAGVNFAAAAMNFYLLRLA